MPTSLKETEEVMTRIDKSMKTTKFRGQKQKFLPQSAFDSLTCDKIIRSVIAEQNYGWLTEEEESDFAREVCRKGRKLFITCVYGEHDMTTLRALLNHGLNDGRFPLKEEDCPVQNLPRKFRQYFIEDQSCFGAAFFSLNSEQSLDDDMPKPIEFDESEVLGRGAFGEVVRIHIPESQRDFSSGADRKGQFAMKITQYKGTREESFHRAMAGLHHHHVVKCLSSFIYSSKFYMIYEKAESAILELVDGPRDMRFAMTAKTLARLPPNKQFNDMTAKNVKRVTQFREDGMSQLQEMVQQMRIEKEEGIDDRVLPAPRKVYPEPSMKREMHYPEEVADWKFPNPLPKKQVKKELKVVEPEDDFVVAERNLGKEIIA